MQISTRLFFARLFHFLSRRCSSDFEIRPYGSNAFSNDLGGYHHSIPLEKLFYIAFFYALKTVGENNKMHPTFYSPTFFKFGHPSNDLHMVLCTAKAKKSRPSFSGLKPSMLESIASVPVFIDSNPS